jgi:hypothetical protein
MSPNKYKIKYNHKPQIGGGSVASNIIKIIFLLPLLPLVLYILLLSHISKYYIFYLPIILILQIYTYNYPLNISPNILRRLTNIFLGLNLYSAIALLYGLLLFYLFPNIYIIN